MPHRTRRSTMYMVNFVHFCPRPGRATTQHASELMCKPHAIRDYFHACALAEHDPKNSSTCTCTYVSEKIVSLFWRFRVDHMRAKVVRPWRSSVAVWLKNGLAHQQLAQSSTGSHEVIWLSLRLHCGRKVVVCAAFRPGSSADDDISLLEHIDTMIPRLRPHGTQIIIAGDFNVSNRAWICRNRTTTAGEFAEDVCLDHGLQQRARTHEKISKVHFRKETVTRSLKAS